MLGSFGGGGGYSAPPPAPAPAYSAPKPYYPPLSPPKYAQVPYKAPYAPPRPQYSSKAPYRPPQAYSSPRPAVIISYNPTNTYHSPAPSPQPQSPQYMQSPPPTQYSTAANGNSQVATNYGPPSGSVNPYDASGIAPVINGDNTLALKIKGDSVVSLNVDGNSMVSVNSGGDSSISVQSPHGSSISTNSGYDSMNSNSMYNNGPQQYAHQQSGNQASDPMKLGYNLQSQSPPNYNEAPAQTNNAYSQQPQSSYQSQQVNSGVQPAGTIYSSNQDQSQYTSSNAPPSVVETVHITFGTNSQESGNY